MFSEKIGHLGQRLAGLALATVTCALGACGEQIVVGTQPAEARSDALPTSPDAGTQGTPPPRSAEDEPDSDGDDDEPSDGDDDDTTELDATD